MPNQNSGSPSQPEATPKPPTPQQRLMALPVAETHRLLFRWAQEAEMFHYTEGQGWAQENNAKMVVLLASILFDLDRANPLVQRFAEIVGSHGLASNAPQWVQWAEDPKRGNLPIKRPARETSSSVANWVMKMDLSKLT